MIVLLLLCTIITYLTGRGIKTASSSRIKKIILTVGVSSDIGFLFVFKYLIFFSESFNLIFNSTFFPIYSILLPIGISFFTLQGISYLVDIYRKKIQPENHFGFFALYLAFFPQLLAGPIERAGNLLPQLRASFKFRSENIVIGSKLILLGLFKKIVLADNISFYTEYVFKNYSDLSGITILLGAYLFSFQIYFDFSAYIDIAKGSARYFNINLSDNFQQPYFATSIKDFWHSWHITLSQWFKDYVYIPLGGKRVKKYRWYFNIFLVFVLSGLWHGANLNFIIWGILHAILYIGNLLIAKNITLEKKNYSKLLQIAKSIIVFNIISFSWVWFRTVNINNAFEMSLKIFSSFKLSELLKDLMSIDTGFLFFIIVFLSFSILLLEKLNFIKDYVYRFNRNRIILNEFIFTDVLILSIILLNISTNRNFIYFQF